MVVAQCWCLSGRWQVCGGRYVVAGMCWQMFDGSYCSRQDQGGWWQHKMEGASTMVRPATAFTQLDAANTPGATEDTDET